MSWTEFFKQFFGKIIALGGTAAIYAMLNAIAGNPSIELKALLLVGGYAIWSKGIAPAIENLFAQPQTAGASRYNTGAKYLNLI